MNERSRRRTQAGALLASVALAACAEPPRSPMPSTGVPLAGSAMLADLDAPEVRAALDRTDLALIAEATFEALSYRADGTSVTWENDASGHYGSVTPIRSFRAQGRSCREYRHTLAVGAQTVSLSGTGCRSPDGTWRPA